MGKGKWKEGEERGKGGEEGGRGKGEWGRRRGGRRGWLTLAPPPRARGSLPPVPTALGGRRWQQSGGASPPRRLAASPPLRLATWPARPPPSPPPPPPPPPPPSEQSSGPAGQPQGRPPPGASPARDKQHFSVRGVASPAPNSYRLSDSQSQSTPPSLPLPTEPEHQGREAVGPRSHGELGTESALGSDSKPVSCLASAACPAHRQCALCLPNLPPPPVCSSSESDSAWVHRPSKVLCLPSASPSIPFSIPQPK